MRTSHSSSGLRLATALLAMALAGCALGSVAPPAEPPPDPVAERHRLVAERRSRTIVICHRGATEFAPENTLEAYRAALDLGADGNEIDIRTTKDGVLVCFHDDMLDLALEGAFGDVADHAWDELRSMPFRDPGPWGIHARIPTLREVFELHRERAGLMHLDIKRPGLDGRVAEMLTAMDLWDHVVFADVQIAPAIGRDPRMRYVTHKPALFCDRYDVNPEQLRRMLAEPGDSVICDDPRAALEALGRPIGALSRGPVTRTVEPKRDPAPPPGGVARWVELLRDADQGADASSTPEQRRAAADRIVERARAADAIGRMARPPADALDALEDRVRRRSLHPDWLWHGLDAAAALRALGHQRDPRTVALARHVLYLDDPALARLGKNEFGTPSNWRDWRPKLLVFPALERIPGPETERLCREYLALDADESKRLGPPLHEQAVRTLLSVSPSKATAVELMKHRLSVVRGRAALECLKKLDSPWARQALEEAAPFALAWTPKYRD